MFTVFSLLCLLSASYAIRTPRITYTTKKQEIDIGSSTELECSVQFAQDFSVLWTKKGTGDTQDLPISMNSGLIIKDSRYSLRHDTGSSTYILQIKDLQQYDSGIYMCQVIYDLTNRLSKEVPLLVRQPPTIFDNSSRAVVEMQGSTVKLECYATGVPTPKVSWRRENNALLPTGGSIFSGNEILIPRIRKEDRGTYYCIAENGVGSGSRRNINVEVEFKPVVSAVKTTVRQAQTFDTILECRVESYPPADVNWVFRSESIVNNQKYRISQFDNDEEFTDSVLTIKSLEPRQFGTYICRGNNRLGYDTVTFTLEESSSPVCPPVCKTPYGLYSGSPKLTASFTLFVISVILHYLY